MFNTLIHLISQVPENPEAIVEKVQSAFGALQNGYYNVGIGALITVAAWVFFTFIMPQFKKKLIPLITLIVATVVAVGEALAIIPQDATWWVYVEQIVLGAVVMGGVSNGLWSMLFKHVLPKSQKEPAPKKKTRKKQTGPKSAKTPKK